MDLESFERYQRDLKLQIANKISALNEEEKVNLFNKYKKEQKKRCNILSILSGAIMGIGIPLSVVYVYKTTDLETFNKGFYIFIVFSILVTLFLIALPQIIYFIDTKSIRNKHIEYMIKKDLGLTLYNKYSSMHHEIIDKNFHLAKTINVKIGKNRNILFDEENQKIIFQHNELFSKTYNFSDIISYEVYENGNSRVRGRAGSAIIGAAFFGYVGLVAGSSMSREINEKCTQLDLIIRINDFENPQIKFSYINGLESCYKESPTYKEKIENIHLICSMLEFIINKKDINKIDLKNDNMCETTENTSVNNKKEEDFIVSDNTCKKQLIELKELYDDGLITEEEYEKKRKQILNI